MGKFLLMPKLDMSMKKGIIMQWLVSEGDTIEIGDYFAEVETGKVLIEIENTELTGIVLKKYFEVGDSIKVNRPIMYVGEKGEIPPSYEETLKYKLFEDVLSDKDVRQGEKTGFNTNNQDKENILVAENELREIPNKANIATYISDVNTTDKNRIELKNKITNADSIVIETGLAKAKNSYDTDDSVKIYRYEEMQDIPHSTDNNIKCISITPQLAWAGLSEEEAKKKGLPVKIQKIDYPTESSVDSTLIKVVIDERWDEILGVHVSGDSAVDIITRAVNAMKSEISASKFLENYLS